MHPMLWWFNALVFFSVMCSSWMTKIRFSFRQCVTLYKSCSCSFFAVCFIVFFASCSFHFNFQYSSAFFECFFFSKCFFLFCISLCCILQKQPWDFAQKTSLTKFFHLLLLFSAVWCSISFIYSSWKFFIPLTYTKQTKLKFLCGAIFLP